MSYYPEPDSHIRDKVKVVLDVSHYATKKELKDATGVDTYAEVDKIDIDTLVNVPTGSNNLKTQVDLDKVFIRVWKT